MYSVGNNAWVCINYSKLKMLLSMQMRKMHINNYKETRYIQLICDRICEKSLPHTSTIMTLKDHNLVFV